MSALESSPSVGEVLDVSPSVVEVLGFPNVTTLLKIIFRGLTTDYTSFPSKILLSLPDSFLPFLSFLPVSIWMFSQILGLAHLARNLMFLTGNRKQGV